MIHKIFSTAQIRDWDSYTIQNTPVASIDLMEKASMAFVGKFANLFDNSYKVYVMCGMGNNGGDGLAIARLLQIIGYQVVVKVVKYGTKTSNDFTINYEKLCAMKTFSQNTVDIEVHDIQSLPALEKNSVIIDAIFGSGLNKPIQGLAGKVITWINAQGKPVIAVDMPSGLFADLPTPVGAVVKATYTISFESTKLAFLFPENAEYVGAWQIVSIGLHDDYWAETNTSRYSITASFIKQILKKRPTFGHKGTFGHCLIIGGSYGKIGACVLATRACLRSGAGLVTSYLPAVGYNIMQTSAPEAMTLTDKEANFITAFPSLQPYNAIGVGIGLGRQDATTYMLKQLLQISPTNLVLDADALNILSEHKEWLAYLPAGTILTPHPKEFERLTRPTEDSFERLEVLCNFAEVYGVYVILKGAYSVLATPDGKAYFNTTGNAGMATGGSGDVLTGILTAFLAQGYTPFESCALGMYIHGLAGDLVIETKAPEALIASDLVEHIGKALLVLRTL